MRAAERWRGHRNSPGPENIKGAPSQGQRVGRRPQPSSSVCVGGGGSGLNSELRIWLSRPQGIELWAPGAVGSRGGDGVEPREKRGKRLSTPQAGGGKGPHSSPKANPALSTSNLGQHFQPQGACSDLFSKELVLTVRPLPHTGFCATPRSAQHRHKSPW